MAQTTRFRRFSAAVTFLRNSLRQLTNWPLAIGLLIGFAVFTIAALVVQTETDHELETLKNQANVHLLTLGARLEGEVNSNLVVLRGLRAEISINPDITHEELASLVSEYLFYYPAISHVALAPSLIVSDVYPLEGNEAAIGLNYRNQPDQLKGVMESIYNDDITLTGPINLVQGGRKFIGRIPVYSGSKKSELWGVVAVVLNMEKMLEAAGIDSFLWGMKVALRTRQMDGQKTEVMLGDAAVFGADAAMVDVVLPNLRWQLAAIPKNGWKLPYQKTQYWWLISVVLSVLAGVAAYLISANYRERLMAVENASFWANFDGLTGLPNRRYFNARFRSLIEEHRQQGSGFAVFNLDLDFFREVNDSWGHAMGDRVLRSFARRMSRTVRADDLVARLGGDEFIMVLQDIDSPAQAELLAENLQRELIEPYEMDDERFSITISLGISMFPLDGEDEETLLLNATRAKDEAKRAGRNRIAFFNEAISLEMSRHVEMHNEILEGIRTHQFELYYQPIQHLKTGQIHKCEALIRWHHPEKGLISPAEFIPVAEQTGVIRNLGDWVLQQACHDYQSFQDKGVNMSISVNRSPAEFFGRDCEQHWLDILEQNRMNNADLIFEITESLLMDDNEQQRKVIRNLRSKGVAVAIDDFGTGYSSLSYLRDYPMDFLKIDRSFVSGILHDTQMRTLTEVMIKMGQTLGIQVVAEGVETMQQQALLATLGCDYIQGYLLGRPMPLDDFIEFCLPRQAQSAVELS
ncbi:EAL domain-containing protein [Neptuniibacter sp. CAU 1671]|uniref:bifunctional diguanylate cyclase/phosphodiesterase n=1 Tax=Neptuniibacter sp. CAU 1671 TaxID=3032593 RepID=UPI0023D9FF89|nr:EAL domain-containing protein [Neptuniibacter sp. CAU 1671]MDF2181833.1 EAL domain-containing protein [Neptuniibacter sp. CAU 1671]